MQTILTNNCEIMIPIIGSIIASLIFWFIINLWFTPKFKITDIRYGRNQKPYICIRNKSCFINAYEVVCYINYYVEGKLVYKRTDNVIPILKYTHNKSAKYSTQIKLAQSYTTNQIFNKGNNIMLQIVIVGQNKFGVKRACSKKIVIEDNE